MDLVGNRGHIRTVPMADCVRENVDDRQAACHRRDEFCRSIPVNPSASEVDYNRPMILLARRKQKSSTPNMNFTRGML